MTPVAEISHNIIIPFPAFQSVNFAFWLFECSLAGVAIGVCGAISPVCWRAPPNFGSKYNWYGKVVQKSVWICRSRDSAKRLSPPPPFKSVITYQTYAAGFALWLPVRDRWSSLRAEHVFRNILCWTKLGNQQSAWQSVAAEGKWYPIWLLIPRNHWNAQIFTGPSESEEPLDKLRELFFFSNSSTFYYR